MDDFEDRFKLILNGAHSLGLSFNGDDFIGYLFEPKNSLSEYANGLLRSLVEESDESSSFDFKKYKDGERLK